MANHYATAHHSPEGPGDARPTALQILKDNDKLGSWSDKTILVTGGTAGLGLETVRQLAKTGARVYFTARNETKAEKVVQDLKEEAASDHDLKGARVEWIKMNNGSLTSVRAAARTFLEKSDQLNVLICNAGIANTPPAKTEDGFEEQFATNHLAHFLLFQLLKPLMVRSSSSSFNSRVVMVASTAHGFSTVQLGNYNLDKPAQEVYDPLCEIEGDHLNPMILYGQSKTANIWFANELERRYGSSGVHGLSLHPGNILTGGFAGLDPRVVEKFAPLMSSEVFQKDFKSVEQGAATQVLAAVNQEYEGKGGIYLDNCAVAEPIPEDGQIGMHGYKPWAYNPEGERRLWKDSLVMVGLKDE